METSHSFGAARLRGFLLGFGDLDCEVSSLSAPENPAKGIPYLNFTRSNIE